MSTLKNNTTDLQILLATANALPSGGGGGGEVVNIYDPTKNPIVQGTITSSTGADGNSATRLRTDGYIEVKPKTVYQITTNIEKVFIIECDGGKTPLKNTGWQSTPYVLITSSSTQYIRITFSNASSSAITPSEFEWLRIFEMTIGGGSGSEDLDEVLTEQETLIATLESIIDEKAKGDSAEIEDAFIQRTMSGEYVNDRVTSIGYGCFQGSKSLTSVSFPNVTSVKDYAFSDCTELTAVNMPLLKSANARAFASTKLSNIDFPLLSSIGTYTFSYISVPNTARLPSLATVPNSGFRDNKGITMVDLATATKIDTLAFYFCGNLESLILRSNTVATLSNTGAFTGTKIASGTGYIYVPSALVDSYKTATNWSTFAEQIRAIEDYPDVCGG